MQVTSVKAPFGSEFDKNSKIVLVNYHHYIDIIEKELTNFSLVHINCKQHQKSPQQNKKNC